MKGRTKALIPSGRSGRPLGPRHCVFVRVGSVTELQLFDVRAVAGSRATGPFDRKKAVLTRGGREAAIEVAAGDLRGAIDQLESRYPGFRERLLDPAGNLRQFVNVYLNDEDIRSDPEIALPSRLLSKLASEGVVGSATAEHISVMGFQERSLDGWRNETLPELLAMLRDQQADGIVLAPA